MELLQELLPPPEIAVVHCPTIPDDGFHAILAHAGGVLVLPSDTGRRVRMGLFGRTAVPADGLCFVLPRRRPVACMEPNRSCPKNRSLLGGRPELPVGFAAALGHVAQPRSRRRQDRWRERLIPRQQAVAPWATPPP